MRNIELGNHNLIKEKPQEPFHKATLGLFVIAGVTFLLNVPYLGEAEANNPYCSPAMATFAERTGDFTVSIGDLANIAYKQEPIGNLAIAGSCLNVDLPTEFEEDSIMGLKRIDLFNSPEQGRAVVVDSNGARVSFSPWDSESGADKTIFEARPDEVLVVVPDEDGVSTTNTLTRSYVRVQRKGNDPYETTGWTAKSDLRKVDVK